MRAGLRAVLAAAAAMIPGARKRSADAPAPPQVGSLSATDAPGAGWRLQIAGADDKIVHWMTATEYTSANRYLGAMRDAGYKGEVVGTFPDPTGDWAVIEFTAPGFGLKRASRTFRRHLRYIYAPKIDKRAFRAGGGSSGKASRKLRQLRAEQPAG